MRLESFMRRRRRSLIATLLVFGFIAAFEWRYFYDLGDWVRQTRPYSYQYEVQKEFAPTHEELDCLHGTTPATDTNVDPIPNHVHFIFGLANPYEKRNAGTFDFLAFLAVRSASVGVKAERVFLHYTYLADPPSPEPNRDPYSNPWVSRLRENVTLVYHSPEEIDSLKDRASANWQAAHVSDVLRLKILSEQGGIYLDIDAFGLRPFTDVLRSPRDMVMGHEGGNRAGLCNAIMVARAGSSFIERWIAAYDSVDLTREWNYHSVLLPKEMQMQTPDDVCTLPPDSFFWPTWTWKHVDWMHESIDKAEADHWTSEIERHGGSLFENQLAYHGWSQMSWDRYLKRLTPEIVRTHDTRFNLMVRRFLMDDMGIDPGN